MSMRCIAVILASGVALVIALWPVSRKGVASHLEASGVVASHRDADEANKARLVEAKWVNQLAENDSIYGSSPEAVEGVVASNGEVNFELLRKQGLSKQDCFGVLRVVQRARKAMSDSFAARLEIDRGRTNPQAGIFTYVVKSDRPKGDGILSLLRSDLVDVCGAEKAEKVYLALRLRSQFGSFGREDVQITVKAREDSEIGASITVHSIDPATKARISIDEISSTDKLQFFFGDSFEVRELGGEGK